MLRNGIFGTINEKKKPSRNYQNLAWNMGPPTGLKMETIDAFIIFSGDSSIPIISFLLTFVCYWH